MDDDDNNDRAEPSPEPETAPDEQAVCKCPIGCGCEHHRNQPQPPASEAQTPGVPERQQEQARQAERDITALVNRFSSALLDKLIEAEAKYNWGGGWKRPDWVDDLRREVRRHIEKGDPRDVAAYCAFAWHHGWSLSQPSAHPELEAELAQLRAERDEQLSILDAVGPITCRDGVKHARIDECLYCTIDALRARVGILDAQEVELPELDKTKRAWGVLVPTGMLDHLKQRERQLLDALRAIQACRELAQQQDDALKAHSVYCETGKETDFNRFARLRDAAIVAYDALAGKGE